MIESEKVLERKLVDKIKKLGGHAYKFVSPNQRGVPDRLCVLPHGITIFVELKTTGKKPTKLQVLCMDELRALGQECVVVDSSEALDGLINRLSSFIQAAIGNYSRQKKIVVTIQDVVDLLCLNMVSFDDFSNTVRALINAPELFSPYTKHLLTYTKRLERTDQEQSLEISKLLGGTENASIGIEDNGKEAYRAYTVDDLIQIISWLDTCQDLTISPRKDLWIVQYHFIKNNKVCSRETSDISLVQALYNILISVYKRSPLC